MQKKKEKKSLETAKLFITISVYKPHSAVVSRNVRHSGRRKKKMASGARVLSCSEVIN